MQKSDHSGPTLLLQNDAPTGVPGMVWKLELCGCIQRRLFFELRHLPRENAMLKLSLCVCIQRGLIFKCYHPKREKVNSPPSFFKGASKVSLSCRKVLLTILKNDHRKKNNQKRTVISMSKMHVKSEGKSPMIFHHFLWFAIRPQREAEFNPRIFIKFEYRKNGHLLKRYKNNINWDVSIIPVGWCLGPMPWKALKTNRKST